LAFDPPELVDMELDCIELLLSVADELLLGEAQLALTQPFGAHY
jgi:hypothetical protein